ncbi:MAG: Hsp70 family protein, partial [Myxococcota bacterium]
FAENLSSGGLFVRHDKPPAVGSRVLIEFVLPDGQTLSRVAAEVVHARPAMTPGEQTAGMGLKFVEYDEQANALRAQLAGAPGLAPLVARGADEPPLATQRERLQVPGPAPLLGLTGPVVGIDLGTSNSSIAIVQDGRPRVITSQRGYEVVPSVLFVPPDGRPLVGHRAVERMILEPHRAIYGSKRFLGRPYASREVRTMGHFFTYALVEGPSGACAARVGETVLPLEEVSAHILRSLREIASQELGDDVVRAVISVPAYFGETQRQAVREAGRLAGLFVERVLNEPTAAAIAYGHERNLQRTALIYDLGGGTFDASLLHISGDEFEVLASDGDPFLGGADFDDRLTEYALSAFERAHHLDLHGDPVAIQRIRFAAELAKRQLSEVTQATIDLPYIANAGTGYIDLHLDLERELLESLTQDLVERTLGIVQNVLDRARISSSDIDDVVLVGGQSRSPHVRRRLAERFGHAPNRTVHPDQAVALGAAIVADTIRTSRPLRLVDILPASIRIAHADGTTSVLLPRGARLPAGTHFEVSPNTQAGSTVDVALYRGEGTGRDENTYLGSLRFPPVASSAAANAKVKVSLAVNAEGILSVSARHPLTGETQALDVSLVSSTGKLPIK